MNEYRIIDWSPEGFGAVIGEGFASLMASMLALNGEMVNRVRDGPLFVHFEIQRRIKPNDAWQMILVLTADDREITGRMKNG